MRYIKQLDAVRAFAILIVIIQHWQPEQHLSYLTSRLDGVAVFFVLSGFLITNILFENRDIGEQFGISKASTLRKFYFRRALRILPVYYMLIFVVFIFSNKTASDAWKYYLTYTSNFYVYKKQQWGELAHLWSLGVEEQFYLLWPFVILFCRKKFLLPVILLFISIGMVTPYLFHETQFTKILTFTCFGSLGLGALLSFFNIYYHDLLIKYYAFIRLTAVIALAALVIELVSGSGTTYIYYRNYSSILTFWLITYILLGKFETNRFSSFILNNKLLLRIGKVSYGLYLYHYIFLFYTNNYLRAINEKLPSAIKNLSSIYLLENLILLIIVTQLSWKLIELPFLKLKRVFKYKPEEVAIVEINEVKAQIA